MEILVVVTIIGILAAIAVPNYIHALEQGRKDACAANIQVLTTQVERYRLEHGDYPALDETDLVEFLTGMGYLVNQQVSCPLQGTYYLDSNGLVQCNHAGHAD